jgi:hypothetical protein
MYKNVANSYIRLTFGTEWIGLTYCLHREKLEQLISRIDKYESQTIDPCQDERNFNIPLSSRAIILYLPQFTESYVGIWSRSLPWGSETSSSFNRQGSRLDVQSGAEDQGRPYLPNVQKYPLASGSRRRRGHSQIPTVFSYVCGGLRLWWTPFACLERAFSGSNLRVALEDFRYYNRKFGCSSLTVFLGWTSWILVGVSRLDHEWLWWCVALIVYLMLSMATILFALLYVFARVFLVIESFLSLVYLPESVLITPNFSLYFPHIG